MQAQLEWQPNSYYRLRDSRFAARILAIEADRLRGEVLLLTKLRWVNGEPGTEAFDIEGPEEWNLQGNSVATATHDLMELIPMRS